MGIVSNDISREKHIETMPEINDILRKLEFSHSLAPVFFKYR
jgi:hypothetical protein